MIWDELLWRITRRQEGPQELYWRHSVAWIEKLQRAKAELAARNADPFRAKVEAAVRGMEAMSTHSLLELIGLPKTTGNGRRIAPTMRTLGFIPIKSRRFEPGGWRDTVTRGWARPFRALNTRDLQSAE
jgi:hypothetical protein